MIWSAAAFAASFYVVDIMKPNCSDTGPGTVTVPFCSISAGVTRGGPGIAILVKPGVYREQVTLPVGGAAGNPFTIQAVGAGVIVEGADDFSSPGQWTNFSGNIWRAVTVTWEPTQVLVDGSRLDAWQSDPGTLPAGSFRFVSGEGLYVNLGGGSPGSSHTTLVSARAHGFRLPGRSWVTIEGFTVRHSRDHGIYLIGPGSNVILRNNDVSLTASHGIGAVTYSNLTIAGNKVHDNQDHGIALITEVSNSTVENNDAYGNSRPNIRAASGIYLHGSPNNVIQNNRSHTNQDTGIEVDSLSNNVLCRQNLAWDNGDHGFSHLRSLGVSHIGDVAWGNHKDGFSIEGNSTGATLLNCIAVDNGLTQNEFNLFVDSNSIASFTSNYNLFWNSALSHDVVRFNGVRYQTVAAYTSATGLDAQTVQDNPRFVSPVTGNFNLMPGSPAIDSGFSGGSSWPAFDANGASRYDDPASSNIGVGSITYGDRGALEYQGMAPTARDDTPSVNGLFFSSAFPNPGVGKVSFVLDIPRTALVEWSVFDLQGRTVWSESFQSGAGRQVIGWEGSNRNGSRAQAGVYVARVRVGEVRFARRFTMVH